MIVVGHPIGMGRSLAYFFSNAWNHVTLPLERKKKGKGVCVFSSLLWNLLYCSPHVPFCCYYMLLGWLGEKTKVMLSPPDKCNGS